LQAQAEADELVQELRATSVELDDIGQSLGQYDVAFMNSVLQGAGHVLAAAWREPHVS
jgi:hypothetical protein